jgi:MbtH protein
MANPFEDDSATYRVLANGEGQHSIWPSFIDVPAGWLIVYGPAARQECLRFINDTWTDMRPRSLIEAMSSGMRTR